MRKRFDFESQHICSDSTEANIFVHGYSAGYSDDDRQALLNSIPEEFCQHTNIFAFWPSNHYAHFDLASLLKIGSLGLGTAISPLMLAGRFTMASGLVRNRVNNFTEARKRAECMGAVLFIQLNEYLAQRHPHIDTLNLIGHSLGGRLVVSSLRGLATRLPPRLAVNDVLLMAAAVEVKPDEARSMRDQIRGRLINAYSKADWTLLMPVDETCLGRHEVEHFDNVQIDDFGHGDYWKKLPEVFSRTAFKASPPSTHAQTVASVITSQPQSVESPSHEQTVTLELKTPNEIYQRINDELIRIVAELDKSSSDATLNQAQNNARELLTQYQTELRAKLAELERNAEWSTFTIAFYGETGAGKSTIIETLRILLQERSKLASQQAFRELRERYGLNEERLHQLQQIIEQADARLDELAQQLSATLQRYEQPYLNAQQAIEQVDRQQSEQSQRLTLELQQHERHHADTLAAATQLQALIAERKRTASLWKKLLNLLRKTPEDIELGQVQSTLCAAMAECDNARTALSSAQEQASQNRLVLEGQLREIAAARDNACAPLRAQQAEAEQNKRTLDQEQQTLTSQMAELLAELEKHADGQIIGDGRADYTRKTQRYDFELDGQPFALLDVPGIEGKEGLVLNEIEQAVQTAHAVFYCTNQPAPPQTGDKRQGTLEKIKKHLGAQTEVWTIFNKKITNPKHSLTGRPLTSDDENASLEGLNEKMREQLGEHYREVFPLSALPAFLAATDHLAPESQHAKRRSKILEDFSADELLEKSRLRDFFQLLGSRLIKDSKAKITRANFNKAKEALDQARATLTGVQQNFAKLAEKLDQDGESAKAQLNSSFQAFKKRLESDGETLIDNFASTVRENMYARIENKISNEVLEEALRNQFEREQECLSEKLPERVSSRIGEFQTEVEAILKRFAEHTQELTSGYEKLGSTGFNGKLDFKIEIDNGINTIGLLGGLVGLVLAPFTGGASLWIAGGAILTSLVSVSKAVRKALSPDYQKSRQRDALGKTLHSVSEQLRESLQQSLNQVFPEMQHTIGLLEQALEAPAKQTSALVQSLTRSNDQLKALFRQIEYAGNR